MDKDKFTSTFQKLSPKPRTVLELLVAGKTDEEIGHFIHASTATVRKHIQHLCDHFKLEREVNGLKRNRREDLIALVALHKLDFGVEKLSIKFIPSDKSSDKKVYMPNEQTAWQVPQEFMFLIQEKIRSFCGRKFVFDAFEDFLNKYRKGYFTVIGDAGMGKSAIAAKYVYEHKAICYFNVLQDGRNRPELFLKSIRQQLINRYQLENADNDNLSALLVKASTKIPDSERLVIVVDALDEVEQEPGTGNILYLPKILPDKVYFLLTRRRYEPSKKRLYTEGVEQVELDLTASQRVKPSRDDIQEYIYFFLNNDSDYKDGLRKWIQERNIADEIFIEQVAAKSENNFMYLRYVLLAIARGLYDDLSLKQLPDGLQHYYQTHWLRMGMNVKPQNLKLFILFILVEIGTPIPCRMIADIAGQDEFEVQIVLDEWVEYLKHEIINDEDCYSIYHDSFLSFLKAQRALQSNRKLLIEVQHRIADFWTRCTDAQS